MKHNLRNFATDMNKSSREVKSTLNGRAKRVALNTYKNGFVESFALGRFNDNGEPGWKTPKRKTSGPFPPPTKSARGRKTLIGSRGGGMSGLKGSFRTMERGATLVIENTKPYASIHNEGGKVKTRVTKKFRAFAWAMYYKTKDESWKGLALTKKKTIVHDIPMRKFMGHSTKIDADMKNDIDKLLNEDIKPR